MTKKRSSEIPTVTIGADAGSEMPYSVHEGFAKHMGWYWKVWSDPADLSPADMQANAARFREHMRAASENAFFRAMSGETYERRSAPQEARTAHDLSAHAEASCRPLTAGVPMPSDNNEIDEKIIRFIGETVADSMMTLKRYGGPDAFDTALFALARKHGGQLTSVSNLFVYENCLPLIGRYKVTVEWAE